MEQRVYQVMEDPKRALNGEPQFFPMWKYAGSDRGIFECWDYFYVNEHMGRGIKSTPVAFLTIDQAMEYIAHDRLAVAARNNLLPKYHPA